MVRNLGSHAKLITCAQRSGARHSRSFPAETDTVACELSKRGSEEDQITVSVRVPVGV